MAKKKPIPRKRRTREHIIADLGVNHVERQVLLCGYTLERRIHDYGTDLFLSTYDRNGEIENGEVRLQVKATDHLKRAAGQHAITCRIERADLRSWLAEPMPVILVIYDASADAAYWLYVQAYFEKQAGFDPTRGASTVTVRVSQSQRLDPAAVREFARYKALILAQQTGLVHHE